MILFSHQKWLLGSFLIFADTQLIARRAYEILDENRNPTEPTGVLRLPTGEIVQWANLELPYKPAAPHSGRIDA
jgi:hypothetical protein